MFCETMARDGGEHARPHVEEMDDPDADGGRDSGDALPQIVKCPVPMPQVMVPAVRETDRAIVYEDDLEGETLQADAEPVEKEMINDAKTLLSVVTTGKAQKVHPGH